MSGLRDSATVFPSPFEGRAIAYGANRPRSFSLLSPRTSGAAAPIRGPRRQEPGSNIPGSRIVALARPVRDDKPNRNAACDCPVPRGDLLFAIQAEAR